MAKAKPGRGQPTDYKPEYCQRAADLCLNGATDEDLAQAFEVSARTIYRWQAAHPEFSQALRAGKELADERVVRSLYHKAVGYTFDAVKITQYEGKPVVIPYQEHVPPDTAAAMFWLKNRRPAEWKDRSQHEHSGPDGGPINILSQLLGDIDGKTRALTDKAE